MTRELAEQKAAAPEPEAREAAAAAAAAAPGLAPGNVLALQRTIGNRAVRALLQRDPATAAPPAPGVAAWTKDDIKAVQKELRRLRLYDLHIDGILGHRTDQGLVEAFGGDGWRALSVGDAVTRLRAASRPAGADRGRTLRYGELLKDGVFDVTFGIGYAEGAESHMAGIESSVAEALIKVRGYKEDAKRAGELLAAVDRPLDTGYGRFFVKEKAFTYAPIAGQARPIHSIVRIVRNAEVGGGKKAAAAFRDAMIRGDAAWYIGHGRYGTGPDYDANFKEFRLLKSRGGDIEQTITDYNVLEKVLKKEGDPWTRFLARIKDGTLEVDLTNAGNLRMNKKTPHGGDFGGKLIQWALDQTGTPTETGAEGLLAQGAGQNPHRRYRVVGFYGCTTKDYDRALRETAGFGTKEADIIVTNRVTRMGAEVQTFLAFLDSMVGQGSAGRVLKDVSDQMRKHERRWVGDPFVWTGLGDNPRN